MKILLTLSHPVCAFGAVALLFKILHQVFWIPSLTSWILFLKCFHCSVIWSFFAAFFKIEFWDLCASKIFVAPSAHETWPVRIYFRHVVSFLAPSAVLHLGQRYSSNWPQEYACFAYKSKFELICLGLGLWIFILDLTFGAFSAWKQTCNAQKSACEYSCLAWVQELAPEAPGNRSANVRFGHFCLPGAPGSRPTCEQKSACEHSCLA